MSDTDKTDSPPTWGVVATVREPAILVLAFVAYHLELGASEVVIYCDDPLDPVHKILQGTKQVRAIRCSDQYWDRAMNGKGRPSNQNQRQTRNATEAYRKTKCDWMIHLDADEFLHLSRPIEEEIARLKENKIWLRVPALERCWLAGDTSEDVFSGVFRHPIHEESEVIQDIYGEEVSAFLNKGLAGSSHGKAFVKTGQNIQLQVHAAVLRGKDKGWAPHKKATGMHVLHFDGQTPLHWVAKTLRYAEQSDADIDRLLHEARSRQVRHVRDEISTMPEILKFFRLITGLSPQQAQALTEHGKLSAIKIDPEAAARRIFPDQEMDFTFRGFDLALGDENAHRLMTWMQKTGEAPQSESDDQPKVQAETTN